MELTNRYSCIYITLTYIYLHRDLICFGANVNATDEKHFTPLHHAVKCGNENIVSLLLEEGSNPNQKSKDGQTPLHLARAPKIARLLLDYKADQQETDQSEKSAMTVLLKKDKKAAQIILDDFIEKKDDDMGSGNQLLVYNLNCFEPKNRRHEMSIHEEMISQQSSLIFHPIAEAMTQLKWSCRNRIRLTFNLIRIAFAASLSSFVIIETQENSSEANKMSNRKCTTTGSPHFSTFYIALLSVLALCLQEVVQFSKQPGQYFKKGRNILDLLMIVFSMGYLSVECFCTFGLWENPEKHLVKATAAISIFLTWTNIMLMLRNIPNIGIFIHMFIRVSKTLLFFLLVYSPVLMAFGLCFYVLMPPEVKSFNQGQFSSVWAAGLKTLSMLTGELNYDGTFINNKDFPEKRFINYIYLIQIMSLLFICFGSIVIMNLLVGLTVNEIETLKNEAQNLSITDMVSELIEEEELFWKPSSSPRKQTDSGGDAIKEDENQSCPSLFHDISKILFNPTTDLLEKIKKKRDKKIWRRKND